MHPRQRIVRILLSISAVVFISDASYAIPAFSRMYGTSCSTCHVDFPKLNDFGKAFKDAGFKFPKDDETFMKEPPVLLGAPAQREVFPKAIYPGELPGTVPIAFRYSGFVNYNNKRPPTVPFARSISNNPLERTSRPSLKSFTNTPKAAFISRRTQLASSLALMTRPSSRSSPKLLTSFSPPNFEHFPKRSPAVKPMPVLKPKSSTIGSPATSSTATRSNIQLSATSAIIAVRAVMATAARKHFSLWHSAG